MLLAPEVDLSSIKITVKGNNLRVNMIKPLDDQFAKQLPEMNEKPIFTDVIKKMMKHCENLLIPDGIDNAKVRAVVDNKHRTLVLTAPAIKLSKMKKIYWEKLSKKVFLDILLWSYEQNVKFDKDKRTISI